MDAYELALNLSVESSQAEYGYVVNDWKLLDDAANMLRQQANDIGSLNARLRQQAEKINNMEIWEKKYLDHIAKLSKNIDELEEELLKTPQIKERCEPLCKPSVCNCIKKPLTDEEIEQLQAEYDIDSGLTCHSVRDFARAILKKASEK
jgi:hypothetical protein